MMGDERLNKRQWYAHSREGLPPEQWQSLSAHLRGVAALAREFAAVFGAGAWGELAGLWHDVGKRTEAFQRRLAGDGRPVDHSTAGARLAVDCLKDPGKLLAYVIAGHHAGLPDGKNNDPGCLADRLRRAELPDLPEEWLIGAKPPGGLPFAPAQGRTGFQCAFFIRMLYSCLVDTDFLDTEAFLDEEKSMRRSGYPALATIWEKLQDRLAQLAVKPEVAPRAGAWIETT